MKAIKFNTFSVKMELCADYAASLPRNLSIADFRYKIAVWSIIKDRAVQLTIVCEGIHYLWRINRGIVTMQKKIGDKYVFIDYAAMDKMCTKLKRKQPI